MNTHGSFLQKCAFLLILILFLGIAGIVFKQKDEAKVISSRSMSLETRQYDRTINAVWKDNILLTASYLAGKTQKGQQVNWDEVRKPQTYTFALEPGKTFAYHDHIAPEYEKTVAKTTNANFIGQQGFKSDGYLMGNGVCHFASILYWAAKDANLATNKPIPHDFAVIPEVPREYGVSVYNTLENKAVGQAQNLYITNNKATPVVFSIAYDGEKLTVAVSEQEAKKDSSLAMLISSEK